MSKTKDSFLEAYRKAKKTEKNADLSDKIMAITTAGGTSVTNLQEICVLCDTRDVCDPCDASDWGCGHWEVICIFQDSCDMRDEIMPR